MGRNNLKEQRRQQQEGFAKQHFALRKIGKFTFSSLVGLSLAGVMGVAGVSAAEPAVEPINNNDIVVEKVAVPENEKPQPKKNAWELEGYEKENAQGAVAEKEFSATDLPVAQGDLESFESEVKAGDHVQHALGIEDKQTTVEEAPKLEVSQGALEEFATAVEEGRHVEYELGIDDKDTVNEEDLVLEIKQGALEEFATAVEEGRHVKHSTGLDQELETDKELTAGDLFKNKDDNKDKDNKTSSHGGGLVQPEKPAFTGEVTDYIPENFGELNVDPSDASDAKPSDLFEMKEEEKKPEYAQPEAIDKAKAQSLDIIAGLEYVSQEDKDEFVAQINEATTLEQVNAVVGSAYKKNAEELNKKHNGIDEEELLGRRLDKTKAQSLDIIAGMEYLSQDEKDEFVAQINEATTIEEVNKIVGEAYKQNVKNLAKDSKKPEDNKKPEEKKPEMKPEDKKKPEEKKPEDKKPEDKKKEEDKKQDAKKQDKKQEASKKEAKPTAKQQGTTQQKQGERLPETATGGWLLAAAGMLFAGGGLGLKKFSKEDE